MQLINVNAGVSQCVLEMLGFYVIRYEMRLRQHFCTLLALSLLYFAAGSSLCS